jgi:hypothetical protein
VCFRNRFEVDSVILLFSNQWDLSSQLSCFPFLTAAGVASSTSSSLSSIPRDPSILILPTDNFGENEVRELVSLGFTREQVRVHNWRESICSVKLQCIYEIYRFVTMIYPLFCLLFKTHCFGDRIQSPKRILNKRTMDDVQNCDSYTVCLC